MITVRNCLCCGHGWLVLTLHRRPDDDGSSCSMSLGAGEGPGGAANLLRHGGSYLLARSA
jgi:hypothetical protein